MLTQGIACTCICTTLPFQLFTDSKRLHFSSRYFLIYSADIRNRRQPNNNRETLKVDSRNILICIHPPRYRFTQCHVGPSLTFHSPSWFARTAISDFLISTTSTQAMLDSFSMSVYATNSFYTKKSARCVTSLQLWIMRKSYGGVRKCDAAPKGKK